MVKIGFIGTGFARKIQMPALQKCGAEIVSIASGSVENAYAAAVDFDAKHFTGDWRETVFHPEVDLVVISSPPYLHHQQALQAIENGKHVLCEKPMAMNIAEAEEMAAKAKEKGVLALIDHELRFQDGRQKAFEMIRSGKIGKIRHFHSSFKAPHRGTPDLPWTWWSDAAKGGGVMGAAVSHQIDNLLWFTGAGAVSVSAILKTNVKSRKAPDGNFKTVTSEDSARILMDLSDGEFTDDATAYISASVVEQPNYENRVEVFGEYGSIRIDARGELFVTAPSSEDWIPVDVKMEENVGGLADSGFARGFMAFAPKIIEALREGRSEIEYSATFADGARVQKILDAARESSKTKSVVELS